MPVHRALYRRQGHLLALGAAAGTAAEISGRSDRTTIGVGSPVLEMRNWAMRTTTRAAPKPGHTRSGELGRTSSPESGTSSSSCCNQTGCSPHRGWIGKRTFGTSRARSDERRDTSAASGWTRRSVFCAGCSNCRRSDLRADGLGVAGRSAWAGELLATTRQKGSRSPRRRDAGRIQRTALRPAGGDVIGGTIVAVADLARIGTAPGLSAL